jgi:bacterioferritin-associated ferredoxin
MQVTAEIVAPLYITQGVMVELSELVEVSLDCAQCQRTARTIVFNEASNSAVCTPTGHAFPGRVTARMVTSSADVTTVLYRISYETADFSDRKHGEPAVAHPTWARIHFTLTCPVCGAISKNSVQNNLHRPHMHVCNCGQVLFPDDTEIPHFRLLNPQGDIVYQSAISMIKIHIHRIDTPRPVIETLASIIGKTEPEILNFIQQSQPVYVQNSYHIKEPVKFSQDLETMVFALLNHNADFDITSRDRSIKSVFIQRLQEKTKQ